MNSTRMPPGIAHIICRAVAERLGRELNVDVVLRLEPAVQLGERVRVRHLERQVVQADVVPPVEGYGARRIARLPEGAHGGAVAQEDGGIVRHLAQLDIAEGVDEKVLGAGEIGHRQADVVGTSSDGGAGHGFLPPGRVTCKMLMEGDLAVCRALAE